MLNYLVHNTKMSDDQSFGTKLELPSANSAFKRLEVREDVIPNPARCVNLFGSDNQRVKAMLHEETQRQHATFQFRWTCRCDALSTPHKSNASNSQSIPTPRMFNWKPINQSKEDVPHLLKRLALAKISVENIDHVSPRLSISKSIENRPDSPVPFKSARFDAKIIPEPESSNTPSLFNLGGAEVAMAACGEDQEIAEASTSSGDENKSSLPLVPCLTPPHSPLKNYPRYMLRNRQRQTKLTEWYQPRKTASLSKIHHRTASSHVLRPRPRSLLLGKGNDTSRRSRTQAKKALRFSTEF